MFERPQSGERTVLVHVNFRTGGEDLPELEALALSAGAELVGILTGSRQRPDSAHFIGKGKLQELKEMVAVQEAELVIFNHALSPAQERNLESELQIRVVDRTGLILDIFAQRAQSFEGKMQVELAQLRHLSTRLIRGWTHLERQKGGIGMRGPGESQLETDRRLIQNRISLIGRRLEKVDKQRNQGRQARKKANIPTVSLVGYTNAGKSSLFNVLTGSDILAVDQLFATLDPTMRRCQLANGTMAVIADTVGFIRHLPHELVTAFRSTLQEVCEADLLLHVIDAGNEAKDEIILEVNRVLDEIGAGNIPQIQVFNKIDQLEGAQPSVERDAQGQVCTVRLSAKTKQGLTDLETVLAEFLRQDTVTQCIHLAPSQAGIRAKLFSVGRILKDECDDTGGWDMEVELDKKDLGILVVCNHTPSPK